MKGSLVAHHYAENRLEIAELGAEIFQNREKNIEHVGICIAEHCMRFCYVEGAWERPITGVQHRSVLPLLSPSGH